MSRNTSPHILNTSANLLGFCLIVITSLHISNQTETHIIDELTSFIGILLTSSCLFSFFSIRFANPSKAEKFEKIADILFFTSLIGILMIILLISLNIINL